MEIAKSRSRSWAVNGVRTTFSRHLQIGHFDVDTTIGTRALGVQVISRTDRVAGATFRVFVVAKIVVSHNRFHRFHIRDFGCVASEDLRPGCQVVRTLDTATWIIGNSEDFLEERYVVRGPVAIAKNRSHILSKYEARHLLNDPQCVVLHIFPDFDLR